jgi:hypothetical protein
VIFGWIAAGHQMGAASAAFFAGYLRASQGDYLQAFVIAGSTAWSRRCGDDDSRGETHTGAA